MNKLNRSYLIIIFQLFFASISLLILSEELQVANADQDNVEQCARNACVHARLISSKFVLFSEHKTATNTTDASKADKCGAAKCSLPLAADVIGLEGHDSRDVAVRTGRDKEDAKVSYSSLGVPPHNGQANEAKHHVTNDNRSANAILVAEPSHCEHDDAGKNVRGRNKTLSLTNSEAHIGNKDDRQCVG